MATGTDIADRVRALINDEASSFVSGLRWSDAELLRWIADAQRAIVQLKPEANAVTEVFEVTGGEPRQRLSPEIAYRLIRVEANGAGDPEPEEPVEQIDAVFTSAHGEGFRGYDGRWGIGTLLDSTSPDFAGAISAPSGVVGWFSVSLWSDEEPAESPFSAVQLYDGGDFSSLIFELSFEDASPPNSSFPGPSFSPPEFDDEVGRWHASWAWPMESNVFAGRDGDTFSIRFVP